MRVADVTSQQASLLLAARTIFIANQVLMFPLYYLPGLRGLINGDDKHQVKFPCSISWMTRKGIPRLATLVLWNVGWFLMARAFFKDGKVTGHVIGVSVSSGWMNLDRDFDNVSSFENQVNLSSSEIALPSMSILPGGG